MSILFWDLLLYIGSQRTSVSYKLLGSWWFLNIAVELVNYLNNFQQKKAIIVNH